MPAQATPKGVILLSFGGPDSLEAIEPFMTSIMGRRPPAPLVAKMVERYKLIGGKSPLPEVTGEQAKLVQDLLNSGGGNYIVSPAMLHWHPLIKESLRRLFQAGVREVAAVSLSPHYARVTSGAYRKEIEAALSGLGGGLKVYFAPGYYEHPLYVQGLAARLDSALAEFPAAVRSNVEIIFTAHSLPQEHVLGGDPYVDQLKASISALVRRAGLSRWRLAFQSRGGGQGEWLGPEAEKVMDELKTSGTEHVLVFPIGFATDHIETMYDIDVAQREHAVSLGLDFHRAQALNTSPEFIRVLAETAEAAFSDPEGVV